MKFAAPADCRVKSKENGKKDKYGDFAWKLKKQWNIKVTVMPIIIGTITKELVQGLGDLKITEWWVKTIQTTALRLARILRRVLKIWGGLLPLKLRWCEKLEKNDNNNNNNNNNSYDLIYFIEGADDEDCTQLMRYELITKMRIYFFDIVLKINYFPYQTKVD